jgi:glycosyltransferase involved in cell wall biosynthesis
LIRIGLDLERFTRAAPRGPFRGAIGVPIDRPLVGIVGRLTPIKRHDLFIAMAEHVSRCRPDVLFAIIGDGELWTALNKEVARRGLADRVHFSGWRQDLESVYADLDVWVCCSVNEGTPVSVIEAGAAAKPVVATDVGGVSDVVVDSETGVLVPSGDSGALSEAVLSLLDDPARAAALGSAARRWVLGRYSADRLLGDIRMLYRSLLDRQPISEPIATTAPTTEL